MAAEAIPDADTRASRRGFNQAADAQRRSQESYAVGSGPTPIPANPKSGWGAISPSLPDNSCGEGAGNPG